MAVQKRLVNRQQGRRPRKPNGKRGKVALQAGVHFKTPGGVVHATHKLGTFNGAAGDFGQVEPMGIVQMLTRTRRCVGIGTTKYKHAPIWYGFDGTSGMSPTWQTHRDVGV